MQQKIRFSDFELVPGARQLSRAGTSVRLGARAFDVLMCLVENHGRVVGRDEVIAQAWGGLVVGDNNLNVQVSALRKVLGSEAIVTVPGRGLRFAAPVLGEVSNGSMPVSCALPDRPSVVVLPFSSFAAETDFEWLADSFTEDVTVELSRFRELFVIACNSAFRYRDSDLGIREIARDLGVRYAVEGSVRTSAGRLRASARLIDATSGRHLWAERFDRPVGDLFDVLEELSGALVGSLAPQISAAEGDRTRRGKPGSLDAHGLARRGWAIMAGAEMSYDPGPRSEARKLAQSALHLNPDSVMALRTVAIVEWWDAYHGTTPSISETIAAGRTAASRAIALAPGDHHAHRMNGLLLFMQREPEAGLAEIRRAHEINPNCAITLAWLGMYEATHGDSARGVPCAEAALRLSPCDPSRGAMLAALGFAQFAVRDYAAAVASADAVARARPENAVARVLAAIARVGVGDVERATVEFRCLERIAPTLAASRLDGRWLSTSPDYVTRAQTFLRIAAGLVPASEADTLR